MPRRREQAAGTAGIRAPEPGASFFCTDFYLRSACEKGNLRGFLLLRASRRDLNIGSLLGAELVSAPVRAFHTQTRAPVETYAKIYTIYITFQQSNFS